MSAEDIPNVIVAVRIRPLSLDEQNHGHRSCCHVVGDQTVIIEKEGIPNRHLKSQRGSTNEYGFDIAFPVEATQDEVYDRTVKNVIPTILDGFNATIFAYGATGAGKTHTMMGKHRDSKSYDEFIDDEYEDGVPDTGIIPQSLSDIFRLIHIRQEEEKAQHENEGGSSSWTVTVSYLEVYNEAIRDLLNPKSKNLSLREDAQKGVVHVSGLRHVDVASATDVLDLLRTGNCNRRTGATSANKDSSRSHAVLQVTVKHTSTTLLSRHSPNAEISEGKLSMIDLAGSERASSTQNSGIRLTEGANINKSLLALANCINALSSTTQKVMRRRSDSALKVKEKRFIPRTKYRDSKLTHLLKSSLEGDCRLIMIANISPSHTSFEESHNTLKYANRAKNIKIRPKMHVVTAEMTHIQRAEKLEQENANLRKELAEVRAKRKTIDGNVLNSLNLVDAKRAKHNAGSEPQTMHLRRTIDRLERENKELQDKVREMENELGQLRSQSARSQPISTPNKVSDKSPHPSSARKRASLVPQRHLSTHPVVYRTPSRQTPSRLSLIPRISTGSKF
ncbi:kinesin motor domain-containing protein [Thraustotheca clavata]|uniref:Kinesin-like protein n=1 Tax=Thraustotheca clavata TaxID=74557 RepID=A0A1V9ZQM7_9STRA|nr:kinesin motor domain-containing protein [Thraustotheca clavata]